MWFLALGVLSIFLKVQEVGPVGGWPWWVVLSPLGMAVLWWSWADQTGFTKRAVMRKENERKQARLDRQRAAMGIPPRNKK